MPIIKHPRPPLGTEVYSFVPPSMMDEKCLTKFIQNAARSGISSAKNIAAEAGVCTAQIEMYEIRARQAGVRANT